MTAASPSYDSHFSAIQPGLLLQIFTSWFCHFGCFMRMRMRPARRSFELSMPHPFWTRTDLARDRSLRRCVEVREWTMVKSCGRPIPWRATSWVSLWMCPQILWLLTLSKVDRYDLQQPNAYCSSTELICLHNECTRTFNHFISYKSYCLNHVIVTLSGWDFV